MNTKSPSKVGQPLPSLSVDQLQDIKTRLYQAFMYHLQPQVVEETKITRKTPAKESDLPTEEIVSTTKTIPPDPKVMQMATQYLATIEADPDAPNRYSSRQPNGNSTHESDESSDQQDDYPPFEQWLELWQEQRQEQFNNSSQQNHE
jgi:hypothetical protein